MERWQESCPALCEMYAVEKVTAKQVWARSVFAGFIESEGKAFVLNRAKLERCGYAFGRDYTLFFVKMPERYEKLTLGFLRKTGPRQILRLPEDYTQEELKATYRKMALQTHPDLGGSHEEFLRIHSAYEALRQ